MSRLRDFIRAAAAEDAGLDQAMFEIYRDLTAGTRGFAMVDGGAHKGWHTHRMMQLPGCAAVYAVEADPTIGAQLAANLAKWHHAPRSLTDRLRDALRGRRHPRLHVIHKALQDDPATTAIPWMSSHSHVGRSSIRSARGETPSIWTGHADVEYRDEVSVPATTLDRLLESEKRPLPFIKLDLEGADFLALRGAAATLKARRPLVAFENSDKAPAVHGYTLDDVRAYFDGLDYVPLDYVGAPLEPAHWFDFYEAWAVPREDLDRVRGLIDGAVSRRLEGSA